MNYLTANFGKMLDIYKKLNKKLPFGTEKLSHHKFLLFW